VLRASAVTAAVGGAAFAVLVAEARFAYATINAVDLIPPPDPTGTYGADGPRADEPPITVALLGDSSAAGYGLEVAAETPGALLAQGVADWSGRTVRLRDLAVVGALSSDLHIQVDRALAHHADVAVILIGANDVTHLVRPSASSAFLVEAVERLLDNDVAVLVGTVPDLGSIKPILPPLRHLARAWSRRIAAEQTIRTVRAGGRTVSLADILGPEFVANRDFLFGPDKFHPSAAGYAALAEVLLPSTLAALGLLGDEQAELATYRGEPALPIAAAALRAVNTPGTELDPVAKPRGRLGRIWVRVAKRPGVVRRARARRS
jgi:lysophospholipase L1-like esterase